MINELGFQLLLLFVIWPLVIGCILLHSWRKRPYSVGIVGTYLLTFTIEHWLQALLYILPWYEPMSSPEHVTTGFWYASIGLMSLGISVIFVRPFLCNFHARLKRRSYLHAARQVTDQAQSIFTPRLKELLPVFYLGVGLVSILFLSSVRLPTFSAYISGLGGLFTIGLVLGYIHVFQGNPKPYILVGLLGLTVLWPLYTVGAQGFLGAGLSTLQIVAVYLFWQSKKPLRLLLIAPLLVYIGLSVAVSYFSVRSDIRAVAWDSSVATVDRIGQSSTILFSDLQGFDPYNSAHLRIIDERMGQNDLIGRTVARIESRQVEMAYGKTILDAALMVIPRAIWPDKPVALGGQEIVNKYSGFSLLSGSVQPGQVMEFYLNFGTFGVVLGYLLYGFILAWFDERAADHLYHGKPERFAIWAVASFGLLQVGNSLIAVVGATVSAWLTLALFHYVLKIALEVGGSKAERSEQILA